MENVVDMEISQANSTRGLGDGACHQAVRSSGALAMLTEIANSQYDEFKQMSHTVVSNPIYA